MKILGKITLAVALSISAVAAYYSIAGLAAIFASAVISVIIMGTVLEIAKITTAVWLHLNWNNTPLLMKTYLTTATIVLMFITSMGIFGFLSKAHIEQTAVSLESVATLEQIDKRIFDQEEAIKTGLSEIEALSNTKEVAVDNIQKQIDDEQKNIDKIVARIQPSIDEQNSIIQKIEMFNQDGLSKIDTEIEKVSTDLEQLKTEQKNLSGNQANQSDKTIIIEKNAKLASLKKSLSEIDNLLSNQSKQNIKTLQSIIGVNVDGVNGTETRATIQSYRNNLISEISTAEEEIKVILETDTNNKKEREELLTKRNPELLSSIKALEEKLQNLQTERTTLLNSTDPRIIEAQKKIENIRLTVDDQLKQSNTLIQSLRDELVKASNISVENDILTKRKNIESSKELISNLTSEKFSVESELRKLEAEVGPVKYIAEMVYGSDADKNALETAVRWVILLLVFVFDPLAVVLVLAGIRTLEQSKITHVAHPVIVAEPIKTVKKKNTTPRKYVTKKKIETTIENEAQLELDFPVEEKPKKKTKTTKNQTTPPVLVQKPK
jgi:chromosome segregation ATPase